MVGSLVVVRLCMFDAGWASNVYIVLPVLFLLTALLMGSLMGAPLRTASLWAVVLVPFFLLVEQSSLRVSAMVVNEGPTFAQHFGLKYSIIKVMPRSDEVADVEPTLNSLTNKQEVVCDTVHTNVLDMDEFVGPVIPPEILAEYKSAATSAPLDVVEEYPARAAVPDGVDATQPDGISNREIDNLIAQLKAIPEAGEHVPDEISVEQEVSGSEPARYPVTAEEALLPSANSLKISVPAVAETESGTAPDQWIVVNHEASSEIVLDQPIVGQMSAFRTNEPVQDVALIDRDSLSVEEMSVPELDKQEFAAQTNEMEMSLEQLVALADPIEEKLSTDAMVDIAPVETNLLPGITEQPVDFGTNGTESSAGQMIADNDPVPAEVLAVTTAVSVAMLEESLPPVAEPLPGSVSNEVEKVAEVEANPEPVKAATAPDLPSDSMANALPSGTAIVDKENLNPEAGMEARLKVPGAIEPDHPAEQVASKAEPVVNMSEAPNPMDVVEVTTVPVVDLVPASVTNEIAVKDAEPLVIIPEASNPMDVVEVSTVPVVDHVPASVTNEIAVKDVEVVDLPEAAPNHTLKPIVQAPPPVNPPAEMPPKQEPVIQEDPYIRLTTSLGEVFLPKEESVMHQWIAASHKLEVKGYVSFGDEVVILCPDGAMLRKGEDWEVTSEDYRYYFRIDKIFKDRVSIRANTREPLNAEAAL